MMFKLKRTCTTLCLFFSAALLSSCAQVDSYFGEPAAHAQVEQATSDTSALNQAAPLDAQIQSSSSATSLDESNQILAADVSRKGLSKGSELATNPADDIASNDVANYIMGAGDLINIDVYDEPDMQVRQKIENNGVVNFPYIGKVQIEGRSPRQVEQDIEDRLRGDYLVDPDVRVSIETFRKFYVTGEVEDPNGYAYQPGLTVAKALAIAGGFTDRADRDDINIQVARTGEELKAVPLNHVVQPGDVVIVEMSFF
ncbi:MAG: polysaccharide biosynthesis/export family protein [Vibrio sp.]